MTAKIEINPVELDRMEEIDKELHNKAESENFIIDPEARDWVKNLCRKSRGYLVIKDTEEYGICVSALLAAGMEKAKKLPKKQVTRKMMVKGAEELIFREAKPADVCPVSVLCLHTNIIAKMDYIKTIPSFKVFSKIKK